MRKYWHRSRTTRLIIHSHTVYLQYSVQSGLKSSVLTSYRKCLVTLASNCMERIVTKELPIDLCTLYVTRSRSSQLIRELWTLTDNHQKGEQTVTKGGIVELTICQIPDPHIGPNRSDILILLSRDNARTASIDVCQGGDAGLKYASLMPAKTAIWNSISVSLHCKHAVFLIQNATRHGPLLIMRYTSVDLM